MKANTLCDLAKEMKVYPRKLSECACFRQENSTGERKGKQPLRQPQRQHLAMTDASWYVRGTEPLIRVMVEAERMISHKYGDSVVDVLAEGLVVE